MNGTALAATTLALAFALTAAPARADGDFVAKKDQYLADKRAREPEADTKAAWQAALDARVGAEPAALINIYNNWTKEFLALPVQGEVELTPEEINRFLRCRFTHRTTQMDPRLIDVLVGAARHFDMPRVNIVSGYRSPKYNLLLQKKGRNVSRRSQHMEGNAVDFRVPGISIQRLHRWVRSLRLGGVGFYTHSRFIHADTGRVRYWTAR